MKKTIGILIMIGVILGGALLKAITGTISGGTGIIGYMILSGIFIYGISLKNSNN